MNDYQRRYYHEMKKRDRLIPIRKDDRLIGLVTFFVGNGDVNRYVREDSWSVVDDEPGGDTIYIDHLLTNRARRNSYYSLVMWNYLKNYWRSNFNVKKIRWNRFKNGQVKTYIKEV